MRKLTSSNPFTLPASAARKLYPVTAAFLVALTLLTLAAALMNHGFERAARVALTEGGKFAARIPGVASIEGGSLAQAVQGQALPLPLHPAEQAAIDWLAVDGWSKGAVAAKAALADVRVAVPKIRSIRARVADTVPDARGMLVSMVDAGANKLDEGVMPRMMAAAKSLWSVTASAGEALVARLLPR